MPRSRRTFPPPNNSERAIEFYQTLFGWKFSLWPGPNSHWLVTTGPEEERGVNGSMMPRQHPGQGVVNIVDVRDLDGSAATALADGTEAVGPAAN